MKTRWIVALFLVVLAIFAIRPRHRSVEDMEIPTPVPQGAMPAPTAATPTAAQPANQAIPPGDAPPLSAQPSGPTPPADAPPRQGGPTVAEVRDEIENVQFAVKDFRTAVGENPVGNNAEITRALMGDNLKQVKIPIPLGSSMNADGELCDRWGTPYFFHQLSAKQMEVRSAGPDREMWTADDVVAK